ncbi:MAG: aspartyl/glutamyl-tRNA amidotransferase subunit C [Methanomassiliicoccaceae archaeon]|nr:aspartyl/glutamyl-tRNA amidotransferase subunit C [Methanomassiliicoccaceae archaeon]
MRKVTFMDNEAVKRAAKSAHLALSDEEIERYCRELEEILAGFDIIDEVSSETEYTVNSVDIADVLRDDVPGIFIDPYVLLKDMKTYENYVRGPRLL